VSMAKPLTNSAAVGCWNFGGWAGAGVLGTKVLNITLPFAISVHLGLV